MSRTLLHDAFAHHVWATLRLIDACLPLDSDQLEVVVVPGTYGSILQTMRHLVGADSSYLFNLTSERVPRPHLGEMGLEELKVVMEANGIGWSKVLGNNLDPDRLVVGRWRDGSETHAPVGIRLAQALHHGTDHRGQICTALTMLGGTPPSIDVWDFGADDGRVIEVAPKANE